MNLYFLLVLLFFSVPSFGQTGDDLRPTVTIKDYVDMQAELNRMLSEKTNEIQINNINDNVSKANASMEKRLDGMNEFRDTLKDQAATFITRSELFAWVIAIIGVFFGTMNFLNKRREANGKSIMSGDRVEVKK